MNTIKAFVKETNSVDLNLIKLWEIVEDRLACCSPWDRKEWDTT